MSQTAAVAAPASTATADVAVGRAHARAENPGPSAAALRPLLIDIAAPLAASTCSTRSSA